MDWNISKVTAENDTTYVSGYSTELNGRCLSCTIIKTTLETALNKLGASEYNEGFGLSVVSRDLAYTIDVMFYTDKHAHEMMKVLPSTPIVKTKYLDGEYYMGLPAITFMMWRSMVSTEL
jgi:hypothetical protein